MASVISPRGPYRKGIERRRDLIEASAVLFARHGYANASLRDIAEAVGVSPAGILRLFGSKANLLTSVLDQWRADTESLGVDVDMGEGLSYFLVFPRLMRYHVEHPGLIELFLTLCTEASDPEHPARPWVAGRYADIVARGVAHLQRAERQGRVIPMTPAQREVEVRGLYAAMDGLELQWIAAPDLDLVRLSDALFTTTLERWTGAPVDLPVELGRRATAGPPVAPSPPTPRAITETATGPRGPYRTGVQRRRQIVAAATQVFAAQGYAGASLRQIAANVGVSSTALLRHFDSKENLLLAVLDQMDSETDPIRDFRSTGDGLAYFEAVAAVMEHHHEHPGLIELLLTLCTEATDPHHPARGWVVERYRRIVEQAASVLQAEARAGRVRPFTAQEARDEVRRYFAAMDGLELQWLVNPDLDLGATFGVLHRQALQRWRAGVLTAT